MPRTRSGQSSRREGEGTTPEPEIPIDEASDTFHSASPSPLPPPESEDESEVEGVSPGVAPATVPRIAEFDGEEVSPVMVSGPTELEEEEISRDVTPILVPGFNSARENLSRFLEDLQNRGNQPPPMAPTPRMGVFRHTAKKSDPPVRGSNNRTPQERAVQPEIPLATVTGISRPRNMIPSSILGRAVQPEIPLSTVTESRRPRNMIPSATNSVTSVPRAVQPEIPLSTETGSRRPRNMFESPLLDLTENNRPNSTTSGHRREPETPYTEETVYDDYAYELILLLGDIGIPWDADTRKILRLLDIYTERDFMQTIMEKSVKLYNSIKLLDVGDGHDHQKQVIAYFTVNLMFFRHYIRNTLKLPINDYDQTSSYTHAILLEAGLDADWYATSFNSNHVRYFMMLREMIQSVDAQSHPRDWGG